MWLYCTTYTILGLIDFVLSKIAFSLKIPEGNPVLKYLQAHGLFFPAKFFLTVFVVILIAFLYNKARKPIRIISWAAIIVMAALNFYHLWALNHLLPP